MLFCLFVFLMRQPNHEQSDESLLQHSDFSSSLLSLQDALRDHDSGERLPCASPQPTLSISPFFFFSREVS